MSLTPKPTKPVASGLYDAKAADQVYKDLVAVFQIIMEQARKSKDPEVVQQYLRNMDEIMRLHASYQGILGSKRKELGQYNEGLRRSKPKGLTSAKSANTIIEHDGKSYLLVGNKLVEVSVTTDTTANLEPKPNSEG